MKSQLFKLIEREIVISRFEAHVRQGLLRRLKQLQRNIKARIGENTIDEIGKRELNRLIKDINHLSSEAYKEIFEKVTKNTGLLIENETSFIQKAFSKDVSKSKSIASAEALILGATVKETLNKQARDYAHAISMMIRNGEDINHLFRTLTNKTKAFTATWSSSVVNQRRLEIGERSSNVEGYWQISVLDSRTSAICLNRHNKRWDKSKKPIGHDLPFRLPPLHPHCRSFIGFVIDVSKPPAGETVDDWIDSMSKDKQDELLGAGKAKLYREEEITLRDLLDQSGRPKTLKAILK